MFLKIMQNVHLGTNLTHPQHHKRHTKCTQWDEWPADRCDVKLMKVDVYPQKRHHVIDRGMKKTATTKDIIIKMMPASSKSKWKSAFILSWWSEVYFMGCKWVFINSEHVPFSRATTQHVNTQYVNNISASVRVSTRKVPTHATVSDYHIKSAVWH